MQIVIRTGSLANEFDTSLIISEQNKIGISV